MMMMMMMMMKRKDSTGHFQVTCWVRNAELPRTRERMRSHNSRLKTVNTLNAELNPICHLLALLEAHPILHISMIRVNERVNIVRG
jgi:hypothetical protein